MNIMIQEMLSRLTWGTEYAPLLLLLAILIWILTFRLRMHTAPLVQPTVFVLVLFALGYLFVGDAFGWVILFVLIGTGLSLHSLLFDVIAGFLIRLEHRVIIHAWVDGADFSGRVQQLFWRCIVLTDMWGRSIVVPNRIFLQRTIHISPPGAYRTSIQLWIPENETLLAVEKKIADWLDDSPWVSQLFNIYPDSNNPRVLIVDVSLLRAEDQHKVMRALRTIIEK